MGREFSNGFPLASLCNDDTDETRRALFRALRTRLTLSDVTDTRPVRGKRTLRFGRVSPAFTDHAAVCCLGVRLFVGASTFRLSSKRGLDFRAILIIDHTLISN